MKGYSFLLISTGTNEMVELQNYNKDLHHNRICLWVAMVLFYQADETEMKDRDEKYQSARHTSEGPLKRYTGGIPVGMGRERSSQDCVVILSQNRRRGRRSAIMISNVAILIAFPAENGVITKLVAPRGSPQLVTFVEDEDAHESEEQLITVGRDEQTYYREQDHAGRDDHGGDGGHLRGRERFQLERQYETGGVDPTPVQLFPESRTESQTMRSTMDRKMIPPRNLPGRLMFRSPESCTHRQNDETKNAIRRKIRRAIFRQPYRG